MLFFTAIMTRRRLTTTILVLLVVGLFADWYFGLPEDLKSRLLQAAIRLAAGGVHNISLDLVGQTLILAV